MALAINIDNLLNKQRINDVAQMIPNIALYMIPPTAGIMIPLVAH